MLFALVVVATSPVSALADRFMAAYFDQYPTRATQAGVSSLDPKLEDLSPARLRAWIRLLGQLDRKARALRPASTDEAIDLAALRRGIAWERFTLEVRDAPGRDPLFWTSIVSDAALYPLLREREGAARIEALRSRALSIPRLVQQAQEALARTPPSLLAPALSLPAAEQARRLADLFGEGFPKFAPELAASGAQAAAAMRLFSAFLQNLDARGSARLGADYAEAFRIYLGVGETPEELLPQFERDLVELRRAAAAQGRSVWPRMKPGEPAPQDDAVLLRSLFERIESDHDNDDGEYLASWRESVRELVALVRARAILAAPDIQVRILPSPPYLQGQAYGGVFAAGPFRSDDAALLLLPMPPAQASSEQRESFFRAFNRPFSRMIAAHEIIPGHALQLTLAARSPHKIRAVFPDQAFIEGWGTFSEAVMLDAGWGGPPELVAHLKKALENCARAIVDIRVHTLHATRAEVDHLVRDEALQDAQLAENLWQRTVTSAPQLVTYHLGMRRFREVQEAARKREGPGFRSSEFFDGLLRAAAFPPAAPQAPGDGKRSPGSPRRIP